MVRVKDTDEPNAVVKMPFYGCRNCSWKGYALVAYGCANPDISELTDVLKNSKSEIIPDNSNKKQSFPYSVIKRILSWISYYILRKR